MSGALHASQLHHLEHELLSHDELSVRYPQFVLPEDHVALVEPQAGFLLSERAVEVYARQARIRGAEIHSNENVESWSTSASGVTVKTNRDEYHGDQIIFCGGAWSEKLIRDLGGEAWLSLGRCSDGLIPKSRRCLRWEGCLSGRSSIRVAGCGMGFR